MYIYMLFTGLCTYLYIMRTVRMSVCECKPRFPFDVQDKKLLCMTLSGERERWVTNMIPVYLQMTVSLTIHSILLCGFRIV